MSLFCAACLWCVRRIELKVEVCGTPRDPTIQITFFLGLLSRGFVSIYIVFWPDWTMTVNEPLLIFSKWVLRSLSPHIPVFLYFSFKHEHQPLLCLILHLMAFSTAVIFYSIVIQHFSIALGLGLVIYSYIQHGHQLLACAFVSLLECQGILATFPWV